MKRLAVYLLTTCVLIGFLHQRDSPPSSTPSKSSRRGCSSTKAIFTARATATTAGSSSTTTCSWSTPISLGRAGDYPEDQGADEQADPLRVRHAPPRRSRLRQPGLGGQRRHSGRTRKRRRRDEEIRDRPLRRQAGPLGRRRRSGGSESKLKPPTLLYPDDDLRRRHAPLELRHLGVGHTHGDGFAWLPKERILFTGDACVNGPFNYMGDGDSATGSKQSATPRSSEPPSWRRGTGRWETPACSRPSGSFSWRCEPK